MTTQQIASRYNFIKLLGEGGMGRVSLVEDTTTASQVALKVLSGQIGATEETLLQFKQEFRLMTQLDHPNVCAVYDYGVLPDGAPYFTMEVVPGNGLDELLPLEAEPFKRVFSQLLMALGYVHQQGFVHCDIKSENLRVKPDGTVKLMDFGLMERAGRAGGPIKGTLAYIAPEMARGGRIDQRADLYSAGALAYEMLTGRVPFVSPQPVDVVKAHLNEAPAPLASLNPAVPDELSRMVLKLLAKDPLARYQSAYDVLEDLGIEVAGGVGGNLLAAPFVGREAEMKTLDGHLAAIAAGKPGAAVLLTGPAGMGKSRLLEEFRFSVQLQNLPFVTGAAFEQGTAPYGPFADALRGLLPTLKERAPGLLAQHAPVLVKLLPEIGPMLGVSPAPVLDTPAAEKARLQGTIKDVLAGLTKETALVVALEDWHWADPLSQELLAYLLRNVKGQPLLFLLSYRNAPEADAAWVEPLQTLPLPPLPVESVERMVTSMLGTEAVGTGFLAKVVEFGEGTPFFVEGLLEHLVRQGTLQRVNGRWMTDLVLTPDQMPANLQGLLLDKLKALPESAMAIARIGAVIGREFGIDLLQRVSGLPENTLFDALAVLGEHQIFVHAESGAYRFAQGQLQEVLYASLEAAEKTRLHAQVAAALESQLGDGALAEAPLDKITAVAHHYMHSEDGDKTIVYALEAGIRAEALFANADAERFLTAGLALVRADGTKSWERQKLDYMRTFGDLCRTTGKLETAKEVLGEAIAIAEQLGEQFYLGRMLTSLGKAHQVLNAYPEALACCERSRVVCEANGDKAGAARALLTAARINLFTGKPSDAVPISEQALALARESGDKTYLGEALGFIGLLYVTAMPDRLEEGVSNLQEGVTILSDVGDKIKLNNAYSLLGNAQNSLGDFKDAWESFRLNQKIAMEIGMKDEAIFALLNLAIAASELGDFAQAAKMARDAAGIAREVKSKYPLAMALALEAAGSVYVGQMKEASHLVSEALGMAREINNKYSEALVLLAQVEIQLYLGRLEEAEATADALDALIRETGNTEPENRLATLRAEIALRQGDHESARELARRALDGAVAGRAKGIQTRALRMQAWHLLEAGHPAEAKRAAESALDLASRIAMRQLTAQLQGLLGEIALRSGSGEAMGHFQAMQQTAELLGSKALRAEALFGQAAANPHAKRARTLLAEAKKLLLATVPDLDPEDQAQFFSLTERRRIMEGDLSFAMVTVSGAGPVGDRLVRLGRELIGLSGELSAQNEAIDELETAKARLSQVIEFGQTVSQLRDPDKIMDRSLAMILALTHAERGFMVLESDVLNGQVMHAIRPDGGYQADWAFASTLTEHVRTKGVGLALTDTREDARVREAELPIGTALAVPVNLQDRPIGVLYLDREASDEPGFGQDELAFATALAAQAATALRNATLAAEAAARSRQLEMLNELAEKITETLVVEEVLELVVKLTLEVTKAERAFLMLREDDHPDQLVCKAAFDHAGHAVLNERISMSICNKVLRTGQAVTVVDATEDEEFQFQKSIMSLNLRTLMCVPLSAKGKRLGVLYVDSQAVVNTFTEKDLDLLKAIAGHSSGAIENATLYSTLNQRAAELEEALMKYRKAEHEASTDMLTGLNNRRYFQEQSAREIEASRRHERPLAVIILDVDHFKQFNDTYGHAVGDEVLKAIGQVLPQSVRVSDVPARFGGEEFVVLCPDTDAPGAAIVAERIREAIASVRLHDLEGNPVRPLTASLGVAELSPGDERIAEILERADTALYSCKASGRNQVQTWRPGMPTPEEHKRKQAGQGEGVKA